MGSNSSSYWEVQGSNIGPEMGEVDWGLIGTTMFLHTNSGLYLILDHDHFHWNDFQFIIHAATEHYIVSTSDSVVK
jgi:hypothetical protein